MSQPSERRPSTIFLGLSVVIFLIDAVFVAININAGNRTLERNMHSQSEELRSAFDLALSLSYRNMMQLAMFIASDPHVQELFHQGKQAVEAEGGGKGGERADHYRQQLLEHLGPSWTELSRNYDVRQLHFHLGPGSLSYLRVHRPEKYGDRMDDLRYTIVDTNAELTPRTGFETGRVYSGLRAIVPFFVHDPKAGQSLHVGALEVGTSFSNIMNLISDGLDAEQVAVLLHQEHVESAMWPEAIARKFPTAYRVADHYVEAISDITLSQLLQHIPATQSVNELTTKVIRYEGDYYALTQFPLYDYRNSRLGGKTAGTIVIANMINDEVNANTVNMHHNLLYALLAFVVLEVLLYFSIQFITRRMQSVIDDKVRDIEDLNSYLAEQAVTDSLTGLHNHRFFIERLGEEINKSQHNGRPLSLLMLDIDHFKQVNDLHGHQTGDKVLEALAQVIRNHSRLGDEAGRYGGEEFSIALTESGLAQAKEIAQRLLEAIREIHIDLSGNGELHITASIGVAQWDGRESIQLLIERADQALYKAKHNGRDRIELALN